MCTVSFIPLHDKIFIAHNRDEKSSRTKAIVPREYLVNGYTLLFPRDSTAGGTWIACNKNGEAAVLLNGAFEKHVQQPPYRKSRGLAFIDIIAAGDLYECRWDGQQKHVTQPGSSVPHLWSSVTLYDEAIISKRESWFRNWQQLHPAPSMEEVLQFHVSAGDGDLHNDLRMNRGGELLTVSITVMEISENKSIMKYLDLQDDTVALQEFIFTKAAAI